MVTVREDSFFHLRGRHVQHAHGKSSTSGGEHLSGAMVALMPTEADARRLRLSGGEKTDDLHLTLYFLGEGVDWSDDDRNVLINSLIDSVSETGPGPVTARAFGVNHWNGDGDSPCWVLSVGDRSDSETVPLETVRQVVTDAMNDAAIPVQHTPWVPHVCMAYTDDLSLAKELQKRLGDVTFDRIRVAFAGDYTDIALGESLTAGAVSLRRNLNDAETRAGTDFARMQGDWERLVDSAVRDMASVRDSQREQIVAQVRAAAETDDLDALNAVSVDDSGLYSILFDTLIQAATDAGVEQQREAESQGVEVPEWSLDNLTAAAGARLLQSIARVTARILSTSLVQSAVRRSLTLIGRPSVSPEQVASEVDTHLSELSESGPRESIGGAISAAQNEGRRTVLSVAPIASSYTASEILDKNACGPCRAIDGESFSTLADANQAYPSGGYVDCLGGVRCRGTIVAVWDEGE